MRDFVFRLAFVVFCLTSTSMAIAQDECVPFNAEDTKIVDRGPVKTVVGPLAEFNPCHSSVRLDTPSFFAKKRGEKPPLVIIAHGGGGLTVIANAPNPAGVAILKGKFDEGVVDAGKLLLPALPPTVVAAMAFKFL